VQEAEITKLPFADGGEGFAECMANSCKADTLYIDCSDIYGKPIKAPIYVTGDTAIIDCASASGLQTKKDVFYASSYGTGELIESALLEGFHNIVLGLGGTGCCDGGAGALAALGAVFRDEDYDVIPRPVGADLNNIFGADFRNVVKGINFTFACDVTNEFYGKNGAAYVFAPQKGADKTQVSLLDDGLRRLNAFLPRYVGRLKGAGAAGGICGGLYSVFGGTVKSGFDVLSESYSLEKKIAESDFVITGEGKTDSQTLMGKLPFKISRLCEKYSKPCICISGSIDSVNIGTRMLSVVDADTPLDYALSHPKEALINKSKIVLQ
jgi:glycerate kinase